ncbi:unnamed protein product [Closterium sp. NIES-53]
MAAALGASASAAPGTGESAAPGAGESTLSCTAPTEALHTFTLDSGASRSFFRDSTTLTPLSRPYAVSLADPFGALVLVHSSTVLPGVDLQDAWVDQFTPGGQRVTHCTCSRTGRHLATFTRRPGLSLYTLTTASPPVSASAQVAVSSQVFAAASRSSPASAPCSCCPLSHETLLWHHCLGHPSLPRLRGMASRTLVSGLPRSLPPLPPGPAPTCVPCVEGRQRTAPHSSTFPPTEAPLQTLHRDVWGPARVRGQGHERYFLLVVDDYSRYTTVFSLRSKGEVPKVLIDWIRGARCQLSERFGSDLPVLRLHSNRGGEFSYDLLRAFSRAEGIHQTFTLPASPQQNGIAERRIGMLLSAILQRTLSSRAVPCVFLGFPPDAPGWHFYHPTLRRVLSFQDVTFDESVSYYHPAQPVEVAVDSGAARGAEPAGAGTGGAELGGAEPERVESGGAEPERVEPGGVEPERVEPGGADPWGIASGGAEPARAETGGSAGVPLRRDPLSPQRLREWYARRCRRATGAASAGAAGGAAGAGAAGGAAGVGAAEGAASAGAAGGAAGAGAAGGAAGAGVVGGPAGVGAAGAAGPGGARTGGTGAAGNGGAAGVGAASTSADGAARAITGDPGAEGTSAASAVSGGATRPQPYYVLQQVLGLPPSPSRSPPLLSPPPVQSQSQLQLSSPLPGPSPYSRQTRGLTERREPESHPMLPESRSASPVRTICAGRRVSRPRPPLVHGTDSMTLHPSTASQRVPLPSPPASSLPDGPDLESDSLCAASPTLVDFAAACRLDYATSLVAESASASVCPPSVRGECALGKDVLEEQQEDFECFATATAMDAEMASWKSTGTYIDEVPPPGANIVSGMWIFKTFSPTPKMTTLRVLLHIAAQRDYELHSLDFSTAFLQGSLHEEIWLCRPPGFTGSFPACTLWSLWRPVYGVRQAPREWHDTLRTTLATLGFAPSTADPSLFLCTHTTLPPFYVLLYVDDLVFATSNTEALAHVKSELQKRHTCTDLAPPSDESVEPSGPYSELVGCLIYLITRTRPDLAYPLSLLARYVAPGRHRKGYTFSLGFGSVSSWSTRSSSVLSSSCEAEIYAGAMAAQELRWLTYLLTDLGEVPRSPPVLYQRGQLRLAYMASQANTADVLTKALQPCDHQRFCTVLGLVPTVPHLLTS